MFKEQVQKINKKEDDFLINITNEILLAKLGSRPAFMKLWDFYKPIVVRNVDRFCNLSKGFEQYRIIMLKDSYVFFWDIINSYDFNSDIIFSYYVDSQLLDKTRQKIKGNRHLPSELMLDEKIRDFRGYKNKTNRNSLIDLRISMKNLTQKQLKSIYLYHYVGLEQDKAAQKEGISQKTLSRRLVKAYKRLKKPLKKLAWARLSRSEKIAIGRARRTIQCQQEQE